MGRVSQVSVLRRRSEAARTRIQERRRRQREAQEERAQQREREHNKAQHQQQLPISAFFIPSNSNSPQPQSARQTVPDEPPTIENITDRLQTIMTTRLQTPSQAQIALPVRQDQSLSIPLLLFKLPTLY